MNVLGLYVWKEWRDQRVGVIGMVAVVPLLFAIAAAAWSRSTLDMVTRPGLAASAGALLALLAVGMDLIPGELRRGRARFLERLPAGLSRAFFAKFVFFGVFTAFAAVYAGAIACALHVASFGTFPDPFLESTSEPYVLLAVAGALWVFAVSSWVTHGALALPATVLVVAILFAPMWLVFGPHSIVDVRPWELRAFCALSACGAGVSAWASFVRGYRFGAVPVRAARMGAIAAVLCLLPAWSWSAWRWYSTNEIVPFASTFHITSASLTDYPNTLFVEAQNCDDPYRCDRQRNQTLLVDIETGRWRAIGGPSSPVVYAPGTGTTPVPRIQTFEVMSRDRTRSWLVDGSGNVVEGERGGLTGDLVRDRIRRGWRWAGLGFHVHSKEPASLYDPFRKRIYDPNVLFPAPLDRDAVEVHIRPGSWLISRRSQHFALELFDPDTSNFVPLAIWQKTDRLGPELADGRFVVGDQDGLCVYSPETGARERLRVRGDLPPVESLRAVSPFGETAMTVHPHLFQAFARDRVVFAVLDDDELEVSLTASCSWPSHPIGMENNDTVLVLEDYTRIVRLHMGSTDREVVFPR